MRVFQRELTGGRVKAVQMSSWKMFCAQETGRSQRTANARSIKKKILQNLVFVKREKEMAWKKTEGNVCGAWKMMEDLNWILWYWWWNSNNAVIFESETWTFAKDENCRQGGRLGHRYHCWSQFCRVIKRFWKWEQGTGGLGFGLFF